MLVSHTFDEGLLPGSLRLHLSELNVELCMSFPINGVVCSRAISFPFVAIVESVLHQYIDKKDRRRSCVLEASILVGCSSGLYDVCRRRLSDTQIHQGRHRCSIQYVPSVYKGFGCNIRELFKAQDRLLCSDKCAGCVDVQVSTEVTQGKRCWILRIVWSRCTSFTNVRNVDSSSIETGSYHYK